MGTRIVVMDAVVNPETGLKEGVVQQIDAPLKLYNEPANMFVAGFLGSPPMNFVAGSLRREGDIIIFKEKDGGAVELNLGSRPEAQAFVGKEVILGVRPENCEVVPTGSACPSRSFTAVVDLVEHMGAETHFHLETGAHTIISKSHANLAQSLTGDRLAFEVAVERAHLFDPLTRARIR